MGLIKFGSGIFGVYGISVNRVCYIKRYMIYSVVAIIINILSIVIYNVIYGFHSHL